MDVANVGVSTPTTPLTLEDTVAGAEADLAQAQIELEHTRAQLDHLTRQQHSQLGPLYDRLDQLDLDIAAMRATLTGDPEDLRRLQALYGAATPEPDPLTDPLVAPPPRWTRSTPVPCVSPSRTARWPRS